MQRKNYKATSTSSEGTVSKKSRKIASSSGCPVLNRTVIQMLSEEILTEVQDIEQIVKAGKKIKACPYYASRASVGDAQVFSFLILACKLLK